MPLRSARRLIPPALLTLAALVVSFWDPLAREVARDLGPDWAEALRLLAGTVGWLALAWLARRTVDLALRRASSADPHGPHVPKLLGDILAFAIFLIALVGIVATVFDQSVTGLVATSGVLVAVLGFALRNIIADIFSGLAINMERPYRIGDWIEPEGGVLGRVVEITWRSTRLETRDGNSVVLPNGLVAGRPLTNYSTPQRRARAAVPVVLDHDVPAERARRVLLAAVQEAALRRPDRLLREPAPDVLVDGFTERGVRYVVRYWAADHMARELSRDAVTSHLHRHLRLAGIEIPHARQDLVIERAPPPPDPQSRRAALLSQVDLFRALGEDEVAALAGRARTHVVGAGREVVRVGDPGSSVYVVAEGLLEVRDARGVILNELGPGDVFGEMSLLTGEPRSATVATRTEATLHEIDGEGLRPILRARPELATELGRIIAERQRAAQSRAQVPAAAAAPGSEPSPASLFARIRDYFGLDRSSGR